MSATVSAQELGQALNITKRAVNLRSKRDNWPFTHEPVKGGREKRFIIRHLPEELRITLAQHRAATQITTACPSTQAGAAAAVTIKHNQAGQAEKTAIMRERQLELFNQIAPDKQATAFARSDVLKAWNAYLSASASKSKKQDTTLFCRLYNDHNITMPEKVRTEVPKISWSSLKRWQKQMETDGLPGLVNGYRNPKKGKSSLTSDHQDFALAMIIQYPDCSINTIMDALATKFQDMPHSSSVRRFLNQWKEENSSQYLLLTNPDEWKSRHMFAVGDASEQCERLNQIWEFDSTPADVMLTDGRHCLIGVIEVYTRRLKLLVSKTSKATAVAALIRRAILDWGVPETAKTDNGADYVSRHITQVFESLQIEQKLCPPFTPEAKPHIERSFRTFSHGITTLLPGFIGHSVADRKAIEARKSFAERLMQRDATVELRMTAEELQALCDRWCTAIYHQNRHRGLDNKTPAEVARLWMGIERRITNERALDILLAEAPRNGGQRVVTKDGINVDNINYFSEALSDLAGKTVRVKLDKTDLGTIYLFDSNWKFLCTAHDPMRKGLNRAEEAAKLKARQKKLMAEGRKELKKLVNKQALEEIHNEILEHREAQIAKVIELPKKSETYTTPDLEEASKAVSALEKDKRELDEIDEILSDVIHVAEPEQPKKTRKTEKVVPLFLSDSDQYNWIKTRERSVPGLSRQEYDWLTDYYNKRGGRMYLELEGDLRKKIGLAKQAEAEG